MPRCIASVIADHLAEQDADLAGLAPATIILAQIDPLRSDGEAYAKKLRGAGVPVTVPTYDGVTQEFFGMAAVADKAKQAQKLAGEKLKAAFAGGASGANPATPDSASPPGTTPASRM